MWYPLSTTTAAYQNINFVPIMAPVFSEVEKQQASQVCGNDRSCLLDFAATKNPSVANATATASNVLNSTSQILCKCVLVV